MNSDVAERKSKNSESTSAALTLPPGFADRLDVNVHAHVLLGSLLTTVERRHRDSVALLLLIAQPLRVPDVTWGRRKEISQPLRAKQTKNVSLWKILLLTLKITTCLKLLVNIQCRLQYWIIFTCHRGNQESMLLVSNKWKENHKAKENLHRIVTHLYY